MQKLATFLREVRWGDSMPLGESLTIIPLLVDAFGERDYDLFEEALRQGRVSIEECKNAEVGALMVTVRGSRPVLLLEGTLLEGGLQTRTVNLTLMLEEGTHDVAVSCVERGRWGKYRPFHAWNFLLDSELRSRKTAAVIRHLRRYRVLSSAQTELWDLVAEKLHAAKVSSKTEAFSDLLSSYGDDIAAELVAQPLKTQVGALVLRNSRVLGLDLFDHPEIWQAVAQKVLGSYVIAARWALMPDSLILDDFLAFLQEASVEVVPAPVGLGRHLLLEGSLIGFGLEEKGRIRHLFVTPLG